MIGFKGGSRSPGGARTGRGKDFTGLVAYLIRGSRSEVDPRRVAWISYRNLDGVAAPAPAAQLMRACAGQRSRAAKPVYHFGLSLPASDHLDPEQWKQAVAPSGKDDPATAAPARPTRPADPSDHARPWHNMVEIDQYQAIDMVCARGRPPPTDPLPGDAAERGACGGRPLEWIHWRCPSHRLPDAPTRGSARTRVRGPTPEDP